MASLLNVLVVVLAQIERPLTSQERPELEVYQRLLLVLAAIALGVYLLWSAISRYRSRRRNRM